MCRIVYKNIVRIDEVYQAALEAGSGGIRWNSSTKYIQLMDQNKNWVNYKPFDAYGKFKYVTSSTTNSLSYTFADTGVYLFAHNAYNSMCTISDCTASRSDLLFNQLQAGASRYASLIIFKASQGQIFSVTGGSILVLFYLSSDTSLNPTLESYTMLDNSKTGSVNITSSEQNKVLIGLGVANNSTHSVQVNSSLPNANGLNYACCSSISEAGTGQITVASGNSYGTGIVAKISFT